MTLSILVLASLKGLYAKARDHFIKLVSAIGMTLMAFDISGYSSQMKQYADQYLGGKAAHIIGIVLFGLCFLRASYFTWSQRGTK